MSRHPNRLKQGNYVLAWNNEGRVGGAGQYEVIFGGSAIKQRFDSPLLAHQHLAALISEWAGLHGNWLP